MTNADTARRRGLRRLAGLLLALVAALSVTAHHELMAMVGTGVAGATSAMGATGAMGDGSVAVSHIESVPGRHVPVAGHVAHGVLQGGCAEGGSMCAAAGVAGQPLPAALPQRAIADAASPAVRRVGSLPPGTGPPAPVDATSVLRI